MLKALRFLGWPLLAGLLLALLLIQRYPQWVGLPANEVNLQQAPQYGIAQEGPVSYAEAVGRAARGARRPGPEAVGASLAEWASLGFFARAEPTS